MLFFFFLFGMWIWFCFCFHFWLFSWDQSQFWGPCVGVVCWVTVKILFFWHTIVRDLVGCCLEGMDLVANCKVLFNVGFEFNFWFSVQVFLYLNFGILICLFTWLALGFCCCNLRWMWVLTCEMKCCVAKFIGDLLLWFSYFFFLC